MTRPAGIRAPRTSGPIKRLSDLFLRLDIPHRISIFTAETEARVTLLPVNDIIEMTGISIPEFKDTVTAFTPVKPDQFIAEAAGGLKGVLKERDDVQQTRHPLRLLQPFNKDDLTTDQKKTLDFWNLQIERYLEGAVSMLVPSHTSAYQLPGGSFYLSTSISLLQGLITAHQKLRNFSRGKQSPYGNITNMPRLFEAVVTQAVQRTPLKQDKILDYGLNDSGLNDNPYINYRLLGEILETFILNLSQSMNSFVSVEWDPKSMTLSVQSDAAYRSTYTGESQSHPDRKRMPTQPRLLAAFHEATGQKWCCSFNSDIHNTRFTLKIVDPQTAESAFQHYTAQFEEIKRDLIININSGKNPAEIARWMDLKSKQLMKFQKALTAIVETLDKNGTLSESFKFRVERFRHDAGNEATIFVSSSTFIEEEPAERLQELLEVFSSAPPQLSALIYQNALKVGKSREFFVPIRLGNGLDNDYPVFSSAVPLKKVSGILQNLIDNGVKYAHPYRLLDIGFEYNRERGELIYRDNGIGMEQGFADSLGIARARECRLPGVEGSGIGWTSIADYMEKLGWEWRVFSKPGEGTEVVIVIPKEDIITD